MTGENTVNVFKTQQQQQQWRDAYQMCPRGHAKSHVHIEIPGGFAAYLSHTDRQTDRQTDIHTYMSPSMFPLSWSTKKCNNRAKG